MHRCNSLSCELAALHEDELVMIEFADSEGNTIEFQMVAPEVAEEILYDWCIENLTEEV